MDSGSKIAPEALARTIGSAAAPLVFDVRRRAAFESGGRLIAGARWRDHRRALDWGQTVGGNREVVVYCAHGEQVGQSAAALLRSAGCRARWLEGGLEAFERAGGTTVSTNLEIHAGAVPSRWVTRARPKIDRLACPWLIRRFIDPDAQIFYVEADQVLAVAAELDAEPFDVHGATLGHDGERCSFDAMIGRFGIHDEALDHLAVIVRGADTGRLDLAPECAGLLAASLGISALEVDDQRALTRGLDLYDVLYAWLRFAHDESHAWAPPPGPVHG